MIRYKTHPDNENYIIIGIKTNISMLFFSNDVPDSLKQELQKINYNSMEFIQDRSCNDDIIIRKDSLLGEYILAEFKEGNEDLNITHEKIRNALDIAMFEEDEISDLILPLFKNLVSGRLEELQEIYDLTILNYIIKRNDFKLYIDKLTGNYQGKEELVYDNGFSKKNLYKENKKDNKQKQYC